MDSVPEKFQVVDGGTFNHRLRAYLSDVHAFDRKSNEKKEFVIRVYCNNLPEKEISEQGLRKFLRDSARELNNYIAKSTFEKHLREKLGDLNCLVPICRYNDNELRQKIPHLCLRPSVALYEGA